jgi:hypothetical protein
VSHCDILEMLQIGWQMAQQIAIFTYRAILGHHHYRR